MYHESATCESKLGDIELARRRLARCTLFGGVGERRGHVPKEEKSYAAIRRALHLHMDSLALWADVIGGVAHDKRFLLHSERAIVLRLWGHGSVSG